MGASCGTRQSNSHRGGFFQIAGELSEKFRQPIARKQFEMAGPGNNAAEDFVCFVHEQSDGAAGGSFNSEQKRMVC